MNVLGHRQIFIPGHNALPEDVAMCMIHFVETKEKMQLQQVALPHAPVGSKFAWVEDDLYNDPRYPDIISALDDHLDNTDDAEFEWHRGTFKGYKEYFTVSCADFHYDDLVIHIYKCTLA